MNTQVIDWLATVENRACGIYAKASERFRRDPALSSFLQDLSGDELCHVQFMRTAAEAVKAGDGTEAPVALDEIAKARMEAPFTRVETALSADSLSVEQLLDCVMDTEFSEWNDLYLFVMSKLQHRGPLFMRMAAAVEQHRRYIEQVLGTLPGGRKRLEPFKRVPHVWRERILIVDDAPSIARLLTAVCRDLGSVAVAVNGAEALKRLNEGYFDVIISDIDMPVMDGMEFFKKAVAEDPFIRDRTVFFSGAVSEREKEFLDRHKLRYLEKPAGISTIKQVVSEILRQSTRRVDAATAAGTAKLGCLEAFLISQISSRTSAAPDN